MSKRSIAYVKPEDPSFLARLKEQIGYKEGPTVETKKQKLQEGSDSGEEREEREDEKPQVVVIRGGDLTAEEVALEKTRIVREEAEAPADLSKPIIFKTKPKNITEATDIKISSKKSKKKSQRSNNKLSFNEEDEEEFC